MTDAREEYGRRLALHQKAAGRLEEIDGRISWTRVGVFAAGVLAAWFAWVSNSIASWPAWLAIVTFIVLVFVHERVRRRMERERRASALYESGIARIDGQWPGTGYPGNEYQSQEHPYSADLDIFGHGSVFERLCIARTRLGRDTLADWLRDPALPDEVRDRQASVSELRDELDFREEVALFGDEVESKLDLVTVSRWLDAKVEPLPPWGRRVARILSILAIPAIALAAPAFFVSLSRFSEPEFAAGMIARYPVLAWGHLPLLGLMIVELIFSLPLRERVHRHLFGLEEASTDLGLISGILRLLESREFRTGKMNAIRHALDSGLESASEAISRLQRLVELLDSVRNQFFAVVSPLLLWQTRLAYQVEDWKKQHTDDVALWLGSVGETEAIMSLAAFSFERPDFAFPEIADDGPVFDAKMVGHPLIPDDVRISNDISLGVDAAVLIVSGSNMSGKSTLMRTIGVNSVLALSGAPVCAEHLRVSHLRIGASIRINDSLAAGQSKFYAEILRLRQIVDLARQDRHFVFLLDEILHGTNSHDRRIGAQAVIATLVHSGAIGLVSTHDLALARMTDTLEGKAINVHFEDHMEDDKMVFDYRMRPGIVERSNALALMRAVGLDVSEEG